MVLILPLLIPILGVCLLFVWGGSKTGAPDDAGKAAGALALDGAGKRAGRLAVAVIAAELAAIGNVVWQAHHAGMIQFGHYLRVDGLSAFFLVNVALTSTLCLVYSLGY